MVEEVFSKKEKKADLDKFGNRITQLEKVLNSKRAKKGGSVGKKGKTGAKKTSAIKKQAKAKVASKSRSKAKGKAALASDSSD